MFEDIDFDNNDRGDILFNAVERDRETKPEGWDTFHELCTGENWAGRPHHYDLTAGFMDAIEFAAHSTLKDNEQKQTCRMACLYGIHKILTECTDEEFVRFVDAIIMNREQFAQSLYFSMGGHGTGLWDPPTSGVHAIDGEHAQAFRDMDEYIEPIGDTINYYPSGNARTTDESEYFEVSCSAVNRF